jgi:hypothetical protein
MPFTHLEVPSTLVKEKNLYSLNLRGWRLMKSQLMKSKKLNRKLMIGDSVQDVD